MSKVNRRKEIKQKEELQAKFQLAISQANSKVTNWLTPFNAKTVTNSNQEFEPVDSSSFFDLPIIPNGAGLYSLDSKSSSTSEQHHKVSDFISGTEQGLRQLKTGQQYEGAPGGQGNSKAMNALMNKMRNSNRDRIKKNVMNDNTANNNNSHQNNIGGLQNRSRATSNFMKEIKNRKDDETKALVQAKESDEEDDEDDDVSRFKNRSVKKGANDMFGVSKGKKKKSKGRPF